MNSAARNDVSHPPGFGAEHPQESRRVERAGADLRVVRLDDDATVIAPEPLQAGYHILVIHHFVSSSAAPASVGVVESAGRCARSRSRPAGNRYSGR